MKDNSRCRRRALKFWTQLTSYVSVVSPLINLFLEVARDAHVQEQYRRLHTRTHTRTHMHTHTYTHTSTHTRVRTHAHTCTCMRAHTCMCAHVHIRAHTQQEKSGVGSGLGHCPGLLTEAEPRSSPAVGGVVLSHRWSRPHRWFFMVIWKETYKEPF